MLNLSLDELKLVAKNRGVKDYEKKSEDDLIKILSEPKTKTSLSKKKIRDIRKDFNKSRYRFSKSKIKKIEENLYQLGKSLFKRKKYYDYDDTEYIGIRDIENLFNQSTDEDYYKPINTTNGFDNRNNYIEYKSKGDKNRIFPATPTPKHSQPSKRQN